MLRSGHPFPARELSARLFLLLSAAFILSALEARAVTVDYLLQNSWFGGFEAQVTITNDGSEAIDRWEVSFDFDVQITNAWNAKQELSTPPRLVFSDVGYNAYIAPGSSASFGFTANGDSSLQPGAFLLNGSPPVGSPPVLSIDDVSIPEGNGTRQAGIAVTLTPSAATTVSVSWRTIDETALAGSDFLGASGTLEFQPGETSNTLQVNILGDAVAEADEQFAIQLFNPADATIGRSTALVTLVNDDTDPAFTISSARIFEGDSSQSKDMVFTVSIDPPVGVATSVGYYTSDGEALAGTDYSAGTGQLSFAAFQGSATFTVSVLGDDIAELTESFFVHLENPTGISLIRRGTANGTIFDNDVEEGVAGKTMTGPFNYAEVLQKSLYFYEAQRSGDLPAGSRVTWRGDSALTDGSDVERDLTGGYYDAGDHVKFGFPMAFAMTTLAWGGLEYAGAYTETGQWHRLLDTLRWGADYFIKCHVRNSGGYTEIFYGQIGEGFADHAFWGPAELLNMERPSYSIDAGRPGSDLAAETAAAFAAISILFQEEDPTYAALLVSHAKSLFTLADTYRGKYHYTITNASSFYPSSGYVDEIVWAALWLYRATSNPVYLQKAVAEYPSIRGNNSTCFSWDDKYPGCAVLLAILEGDELYKQDAEAGFQWWLGGHGGPQISYTPGGLAWFLPWGPLRYSSNTALCAFIYADRVRDPDGQFEAFAKRQTNYALGLNPNGRSFVCGFGVNPPVNPHHRSAHGSTTDDITEPVDNLHTLYGALVSGPGVVDDYADYRTDFVKNEVALDYNAGFTGDIARMYLEYGGYTVSGIAEANPPTPEVNNYIAWAISHFGLSTVGSPWLEDSTWGILANGDGDFFTNFKEYAYLLDPSVDEKTFTELRVRSTSDGILVTHPFNPLAGDLEFNLMESPDLDQWHRAENESNRQTNEDSTEVSFDFNAIPSRQYWKLNLMRLPEREMIYP
ncbi:MAG: glycoside hydrolase family 9 protein [Verrucomicrobiota bacterium]